MSTDTSFQDQFPVYIGQWTNWSKGNIFGPTLTLSQQHGNLLIALTAYFVGFVGVRFWKIFSLVLHFIYSTRNPADGLHNQRQAVLRNASSADAGLVDLLQLAWAWRRVAKRAFRRSIPTLVLTAICISMWVVAVGFSSRISLSNGASEVLLTGDGCAAMLPSSNISDLEDSYRSDLTVFYPWQARTIASAATYAQQCYGSGDNQSSALGCTTFVQKQILSHVITNASCPFQNDICSSDSNIIIDTGYLDSNDHFGLNTPPDQRFQYRDVIHCAPLKTEGYTQVFNESSDRSSTRYYYGSTGYDAATPGNATYEYTNDFIRDLVTYSTDYTIM
jgi:hypothetical protein